MAVGGQGEAKRRLDLEIGKGDCCPGVRGGRVKVVGTSPHGRLPTRDG